MKQKIVFFGTPEHATRVLERFFLDERFEVVGVVTNPDRPVGRKKVMTPAPVKAYAVENNIPVITPENFRKGGDDEGDFAEKWLKEKNADFFVVVAYGVLVPQNIIDIPRNGAFNLHFSLLPKYRGASPIQSALLAGEEVSGISIFKLVLDMDAGDIFVQDTIPLVVNGYAKKHLEAWDEMVERGSQRFLDLCGNFSQFSPLPQDHDQATFCGKFTKADGEISLANDTAEEILRKYRAFSLWPGIFFFDENQKRVKLLDIQKYSAELPEKKPVGTFFLHEKTLLLQTVSGTLQINILQKEGKKPIQGREYV